MRLSDASNNSPIPYRDSKLTRILRNALSGHSKVVIICNITASSFVFEETLSTLKFAMRAKNIKQNAKKNEIIDDKMLLKKYENEIKSLQKRLKEMEIKANEKNNHKNIEHEIIKVKAELTEIQSEKIQLGSILDDTIHEKVEIENELERLKAKILVSENLNFSSIQVSLTDSKSQSRRRNRVSMIREIPSGRGRFQSEVVDLKTIQAIREMSAAKTQLPEAPKKFKTREDIIIEKIEEHCKKINKTTDLWELSIMISADELIETGEERIQNKIEEYENYIKTLILQLTRKDDEIEMLKDELDLCRGNFNRLQKLLQQKVL